MTVTEFIEARLDEIEALALAAGEKSQHWDRWREGDEDGTYGTGIVDDRSETVAYGDGAMTWQQCEHIARHDPAHVLREVEAARAIVAEMSDRFLQSWTAATTVLFALAAIYRDHPDYRQEWKP